MERNLVEQFKKAKHLLFQARDELCYYLRTYDGNREDESAHDFITEITDFFGDNPLPEL